MSELARPIGVSAPATLAGAVGARPAAGAARRHGARRRLPPLPVLLCVAWLAVVAAVAVAAPLVALHDPIAQNLLARNLPPAWLDGGSWSHPFGTNQLGYDIFSRTVYGARPALTIAAVAAVISLVVGTTLGLLAGYFRGWVDAAIMLLVDAQLSTPFIVIAIAAVAAFGRSTVLLVILAGLSSWMAFARTIRAQVLSLRGREFVAASRALGAPDRRILARHLLPNLSSIVIVLVTVQIRTMILFEASMSFLGLGVPPPAPSWGSMIGDGRDYLLTAWWISVLPGVALVGTVLSASLIGDWLRDALDPTLRQ